MKLMQHTACYRKFLPTDCSSSPANVASTRIARLGALEKLGGNAATFLRNAGEDVLLGISRLLEDKSVAKLPEFRLLGEKAELEKANRSFNWELEMAKGALNPPVQAEVVMTAEALYLDYQNAA